MDHCSRKHDVDARFFLPKGENNRMVGFFIYLSLELSFSLELDGYPIVLF
jgi:hypothetical protein